MARIRKSYTPEFKLQAVKMVLEQKLAVAEVARRLDVSQSLLHLWKKAVLKGGAHAFPGSGHLTPRRRRSSGGGPRSSGWRWSGTS